MKSVIIGIILMIVVLIGVDYIFDLSGTPKQSQAAPQQVEQSDPGLANFKIN